MLPKIGAQVKFTIDILDSDGVEMYARKDEHGEIVDHYLPGSEDEGAIAKSLVADEHFLIEVGEYVVVE
jgi:hypothetical protein